MTTLALLNESMLAEAHQDQVLGTKEIYLQKRDDRQRLRDKDRRQKTREKKREQERGPREKQRKTKDCRWIEGRQLCHRKMAVYKGKRGNPMLGEVTFILVEHVN